MIRQGRVCLPGEGVLCQGRVCYVRGPCVERSLEDVYRSTGWYISSITDKGSLASTNDVQMIALCWR